jgi:hypothetical protein
MSRKPNGARLFFKECDPQPRTACRPRRLRRQARIAVLRHNALLSLTTKLVSPRQRSRKGGCLLHISTTRRKHQEACLNPTRPARKSTVRHYTRTGCAIKKSRLGVILGVLDAPDREPRYRSNRTVVHRPPASRKPTAQRAQPGSNTRHHPATDRATNPARAKDARAIPHAARGGAPPSTDQDVPL